MSRILVVDDKEMMRDSVATTLSRKGHAVCSWPAAARPRCTKLNERPVDAVITDLQMPDMDRAGAAGRDPAGSTSSSR